MQSEVMDCFTCARNDNPRQPHSGCCGLRFARSKRDIGSNCLTVGNMAMIR